MPSSPGLKPRMLRRSSRAAYRSVLLFFLCALLATYCRAELEIEHAWARATPPGSTVGAVYLHLMNHGTQVLNLVGAETDLAARAEVHLSSMDAGTMTMRHQHRIAIEPGELLRFEPGGYHVMLMGLEGALVEGEHFELRLMVEGEDPVAVTVVVKGVGASLSETHSSHGTSGD